MIAILTKVFGLAHLELIEDAVQDTFIKATLQWRNQQPDNPEGWLLAASKNRIIDLLRKIKSEDQRHEKIISGAAAIQINELFLDHEVEDSQLRMLFVACHPALSQEEQIAFALKTISGFSMKEIAAALLLKEETIKKRLSRARKSIQESNIKLEYPGPGEVKNRIEGVMHIIYLIFNEGFHSTKSDQLISKDLCGEALRLCKLLLKKENFRSGSLYALFALLCFHSSRLEAKINDRNELVDLEHQDRSKWYFPLIVLGNDAMDKSMEYDDFTTYHIEATIAAEHIRARRFEDTNWDNLISLYERLQEIQPSESNLLTLAIIHIQKRDLENAKSFLDQINESKLEQRSYLYYGCLFDYYRMSNDRESALNAINKAISLTSNDLEKSYLQAKKDKF